MKLKDFKNKKITIMGIGLHGGGVGAIKFFHKLGAKIIATDLRKKEELKESLQKIKNLKNIELVLGQHRPEDFIDTDLIIKNPAVPNNSKYVEIARKHGIPIETDVGIFFEICQINLKLENRIIGITGTKGKSTVTSLIAHILSNYHKNVIMAGNIRTSVLEIVENLSKNAYVILELSSWQLEGLKEHRRSPHIAVITNILPDHLNRYKNMNEYIEAKKIIFKFQKSKDILILNENDPIVKKFSTETRSKVLFYNRNKLQLQKLGKLPLAGDYNLDNLAAAITVAHLLDVPDENIKGALKNYKGLEGRLELIEKINGVKYINDTTATAPDATIAAIETLTKENSILDNGQIILICGGADKNLDFKNFGDVVTDKFLNGKIKDVILLEGSATKKLKLSIEESLNKKLKKDEHLTSALSLKKFDNITSAIKETYLIGKPNDVVLLSPACASFGMFRHEFERGEKFNAAVRALKE